MNPHKTYVEKVKKALIEERAVFCALFAEGMFLVGLSVREAAKEFKTAPGTVSRWMNGHSAPAVVARGPILKIIALRAQRIGKELHKRQSSQPQPPRKRQSTPPRPSPTLNLIEG